MAQRRKRKPPPLAARARLENHGWTDEIFEFLKIISLPVIVFLCCTGLNKLGMNPTFLDAVEYVDEAGAILILVATVVGSVRRAIVRALFDD